jgi:hypothetical protein
MSELMDWEKEYEVLGDFIAANPEIVIGKSEVSIPKDLREEFYRYFDNIRKAVVRDYQASMRPEIGLLRDNFIQIEKEIIDLLHLQKVSMPLDLYSFLHNPEEGLIRVLYNRTFDLLQGKITKDTFAKLAVDDLALSSETLYRLGYEWWAALAMIRLLDPDEAYQVVLDDDYNPVLTDINEICFGRQAHHPTLRIPEFVIHSRKIDMYVAIKMALAREVSTLVVNTKPPVKPRKKTGDTSLALDSRAMILSFMEKKTDVPVIADIYECKLTNPHWMIEYVTERELRDPEAMSEIKYHSASMKPIHGTSLILVDRGSEADLKDIPEDIRVLNAGFDQSKLLAAINELQIGVGPT